MIFVMVKEIGEENYFLKLRESLKSRYGEEIREAKSSDINSELIGEMLDHDAENRNEHQIVGCNLALAKLIREQTNEKTALKIMKEIAFEGGLIELQ